MKANEAPKKIWMDLEWIPHFDCKDCITEDSIEYTRTDAFIEKAEKFFTEKFEVEDYNDHIDIDGTPIFSYGRFIKDFRNYMKGE